MRSLLAELTSDPIAPREHASAVRREVVEAIQRMVMARRGRSPAAPHFGMEDSASIYEHGEAGTDLLRASLEDSVRRHEPRLAGASVQVIPGTSSLRFAVTGVLRVDGRPQAFAVEIDAVSGAAR